jgi:glutamate synthase (NADPH/NADH) large chain
MDDANEVKEMLYSHLHYTESAKASYVLENWEDFAKKFVKVIPKDYKRMIKSINEQKRAGLTDEEAIMSAFQANAVQDKKITKQAVMQ